MPSSRYSAGALAPPLWNWILMSRPIAADGTSRYSTGRPGRENAPAGGEAPTAPIRPDSSAAEAAPTTSRRGIRVTAPRNLSTSVILASSSFRRAVQYGASSNWVVLHAFGAAVPV